jgi:hypothetical protein
MKPLSNNKEQIEDILEEDHPIMLRIALKICKQSVSDTMLRLSQIEAEYNNLVPKRDYIILENNFNELKDKFRRILNEFRDIKDELILLKENYNLLTRPK